MLLQPADDGEIQAAVGMRFPLRPGLAIPPGRGVLLADRSPVVVQVGMPPRVGPRPVAGGRLSPSAAIEPALRGGLGDGA